MKLPTAKKLPSGKWRVQVQVDGKRVSITAETERAAVAQAAAVKAELVSRAQHPAPLTVGDACDKYIASKDKVLSPATIKEYKRIRNNRLKALADIDVNKLSPQTVQAWVNQLAVELSPKSVRNHYGLLTTVLAVYRPDFSLRVTLPQKQRSEIRIPTPEEYKKLFEAVRGTDFELPFLLASWMGLRTSEIRGLTWDCIDDKNSILIIKQAVVDGENGAVVKQPKSYTGNRRLPIPAYIKMLLDKRERTSDFILTYQHSSIYNHFRRVCERCGTPRFRFHDLRHLQASVMLLLNVPDKYAMERMGHSTGYMLKNVYEHTMEDKAAAVAFDIDNYFKSVLDLE